ncbi:MAG TPA: hypothetical protein PK246_10420, partial [Saprospiraceae bacterium]|nr:hypothetical protein [Saprospiraceae bacterium]
ISNVNDETFNGGLDPELYTGNSTPIPKTFRYFYLKPMEGNKAKSIYCTQILESTINPMHLD